MTHSNVIKFKPSKAKAKQPKPSKDWIREGTAALCRITAGGSMAAGVLFHALLELWLDTPRKVQREERDWLFLSSAELQKLSGLTKFELRDRAIPHLKKCPFFEIKTGRITRDHPNVYQIRFDQEAFWIEVAAIVDPTKEVTTKEHGKIWIKKEVDKAKLPYLFRRLYDAVSSGE